MDTRSVIWRPTLQLKWKTVEVQTGFVTLKYEYRLFQLWIGDQGEEEWREVPFED